MDYVTALRLPPDSVARAVTLLREAVALDTSFASAYWRLSFFMPPTSPRGEAEHRALLAKAWAHRDGHGIRAAPRGDRLQVQPGRHVGRCRTTHRAACARSSTVPDAGDAMILADLYLESVTSSRPSGCTGSQPFSIPRSPMHKSD